MNDLISKKSLLDNLNRFAPEHYNALVNSLIEKEPAVDAVPVVCGEWEKFEYKYRCSHCNMRINIDGTPEENGLKFCPNCGADMRKGKENE